MPATIETLPPALLAPLPTVTLTAPPGPTRLKPDPIEMLPDPWGTVSRFNPVLYMVNALRYAMTGVSDVPWWQGLTALLLLNAVFGGVTWWLLKTGYKLRV